MHSIFENLINGNLKDAKKAAKRFSVQKLRTYAQEELLWSLELSLAAAEYLKGKAPFQAYCDAK